MTNSCATELNELDSRTEDALQVGFNPSSASDTSTTDALPVSSFNVGQEGHIHSNPSGDTIAMINYATTTDVVETPDSLIQTELADHDLHQDMSQHIKSLSSLARDTLCRSCTASSVEQVISDWKTEHENRHDYPSASEPYISITDQLAVLKVCYVYLQVVFCNTLSLI